MDVPTYSKLWYTHLYQVMDVSIQIFDLPILYQIMMFPPVLSYNFSYL